MEPPHTETLYLIGAHAVNTPQGRAIAFLPCLCGFSGASDWPWGGRGCGTRWPFLGSIREGTGCPVLYFKERIELHKDSLGSAVLEGRGSGCLSKLPDSELALNVAGDRYRQAKGEPSAGPYY